jgi:hypothetical protein
VCKYGVWIDFGLILLAGLGLSKWLFIFVFLNLINLYGCTNFRYSGASFGGGCDNIC